MSKLNIAKIKKIFKSKINTDNERVPHVFFGKLDTDKVDWRKYKTEDDDEDDDDKPASALVIKMLGLNPDKLFNEKETD